MSLFLHFFFAVFVFVSSAGALSIPQAKVINITKSNELEQFLCNNSNPILQDTIVVLSTNITHYISSNVSICSINTTYSLNLTAAGSSRGIEVATIHCNGSENGQPNTGFAFINTYSLTLHKILFEGCGGYLRNSSISDIINSTNSSVYFSHTHSAVLVFLCNKRLVLDAVNITFYYGFAILAINPMNATINDLVVSSSSSVSSTGISIGSGVMLFFTDELPTNDRLHNVIINKAAIFFNVEYILDADCLTDLLNVPRKPFPVIDAAGFTVFYTQHNFASKVYIQDLNFTRNIGTISGAMLIFHYGTSRGKTILNGTGFGRGNIIDEVKCQAYGSRLAFVMMNVPPSPISPLLVENTYFIAKKDQFFDTRGSSSVFIGIYWPINFQPFSFSSINISVVFRNVMFNHNSVKTTGASLYAREYFYDGRAQCGMLSISLENITAHDNSHTSILGINTGVGIFSIFNIKELNIAGVNHFYDNYGSVFEVAKTRINLLAGSLNFRNNKGERGPAFKLSDSSHFYLADGLNATFINNSALTKGGAIFVYNELSETCTFNALKRQEATTLTNWSSIRLTFINNNALESGSSIFSSNLYKCYANGESKNASYLHSLYNKIFRFESKSHLNNMSTPPNTVVKPNYDKPVYPGQIITLNLYASYASYNNFMRQYAVATFTLNYHMTGKHDQSLPSWHISPNDINQALMEATSHTKVQLRLLKKNNAPEPFNLSVQLFVMSTMHGSFSAHSVLNLNDCPIGFELNTTIGKCVCSKLLYKLNLHMKPECLISSEADSSIPVIKNLGKIWLGLMSLSNGTTVTAVADTSYFFRKEMLGRTVFVVNSSNVTIAHPNKPHVSLPLCTDNREGPLCSRCSPGYSVVFGSDECKECSNWWLLTIVSYAVIGPLFIYMLYALRLTINIGTLNSIIFCGQLCQAVDWPLSKLSYLSIPIDAFLGLEINYPLCFYNGMTEVWKYGLKIFYPVYLIAILIFIIILCRFSVRLSNKISGSSVQLLVTVVHLSFSRILILMLNVFTSIDIYTSTNETKHVWLRDATLDYGHGSHLILMITTLAVSGPILGAYITILLAGKPLMRFNDKLREYIRPIYEAIHAPYKRNMEIFTLLRLLLIFTMYMIYVTYRGNDLFLGIAIASPILVTYTALEGLCRPYKRLSLNILNFALLSLLSIFYGSGWYFLKIQNEHGLITILSIIYSVLTFCLVVMIALHFLLVTGLLDKIRIRFGRRWPRQRQQNQESATGSRVNLSGSFFETCDEVREPLLASYHKQYS